MADQRRPRPHLLRSPGRRLALVAAVGALAVTASACSTAGNTGSGGDTGSTGGDSPGGAAGTTTITYSTNGNDAQLAAERKIIAGFQKANPSIKVQMNVINFDDYDTKMTTALRSGQGADVFRINHSTVHAWTGPKYLSPLDDVIKNNNLDTSDFLPDLMDIGVDGGKRYSLPVDTGNRAFWYNPKLLASKGISATPKTWDELVTDVAKFKGSNAYGYVFRTDSDYAMAYEAAGPYMITNGAKVLSDGDDVKAIAAQDPNTVAALNLLQRIVKTGAVPPGEANMSEQTTEKLFAAGKVAMMTAGPWARDPIKQNNPNFTFGTGYKLTTIPVPKAGMTPKSSSGGWQIGIGAKSKFQDADAKFLAYFESKQNLLSLASASSFPPLKDGMDTAPFSSDPFYAPFKSMLANSGLPIRLVPQINQVSAGFEQYARAAVVQGKSVTEQMSAFDKKMNEQVLQ